MVASSVVTTIMILNYHHRLADTHEMPEWVSHNHKLYLDAGISLSQPFLHSLTDQEINVSSLGSENTETVSLVLQWSRAEPSPSPWLTSYLQDNRIVFHIFQVRVLFLQWIPWLLRMSRPGEKITREIENLKKIIIVW